MSSLYEERLLFCSLCFPTEWERTSAAEKGGGFPTKQSRKEKGRLGFASARSVLQEENLEIHSPHPPPLPLTLSLVLPRITIPPYNPRI